MKKVCIITPMFLPVPAVKGGAIENLVTILLDQNELKSELFFDVFTINDQNIKENYKNSNIIQIKLSFFTSFIQRCINKIFNIFKIDKYYDFNRFKYKKIIKIINKNKYDSLVIENNMQLYKYVVKRLKDKNVPIYFHLHNDLNEIDKTVDDYKLILNTSKKIFVVSNYLKNKLMNLYPTDKIEVLLNVIDRKNYINYKYNEVEINSLKNKFNILKEDIVIGYVGRPDEEKGLLELIKAFNNLKIQNIKLLIVSDDFTSFKYKKGYNEKLNYEYDKNKQKIYITGRVDYVKMPIYYKLIDILVIPTICQEAFGLIALEAKTLNKKIIYSNSGALSEILGNTDARIIELDNCFIDNLSDAINKEVSNFKNINRKNLIENYENDLKQYYNQFYNYLIGDDNK